ncbi:MAG TPA: phosphoribosylanthranilate isomerase [Bacteroidota bacterium]|jgi:phosphoribosylanthranilate isomerase|nr:phosphoribosylanthranilate isomerase [Bacteroidota bacterium]
MTQRPRVKICCISSIEEARLAVRYGASAVGLVSAMPSGPGPIPEELIIEIAAVVPPGVATFLLTCKQTPEEVIDQQRKTKVNTLQLVDSFPPDGYALLRKHLPGIRIVQVIHVRDRQAVEEAVLAALHVDALLLDSGNPSLKVKELGGTGRVHDWNVSKEICQRSGKPVFLAGGLNAGNVREAVDHVSPYGVDICSGVRTDGKLDEQKLAAFFAALA